MDPLSISENIRKGLEARERRRGGRSERKDGATAACRVTAEEDALISACARELERTVRESIRMAFAHWEVGLVREVEGIARRVSRARDGLRSFSSEDEAPPPAPANPPELAIPPAEEEPREAPAGVPAGTAVKAGAAALEEGPGGMDGGPPGAESWDDLVEAVKELRREWDQETFEKCFGEDSAPPEGARSEAPPARGAGAEARRSTGLPAQAPSTEAGEPREALAQKLDELIHLVKASVPPGTGTAAVPREVSSEIAREVVGRLKDTLATMSHAPSALPAPGPPPPEEAPRIPIDDIAAMIDQIAGSERP